MSRYISASFQRMPWKSATARPKTWRSLAYLTASSNAPSARPNEIDGLRQRCVLKAPSSLRKPSSSTRFSGGNSTSSKRISCRFSPPIV